MEDFKGFEEEISLLLDDGEGMQWWNSGIIHSQLRRSFIHDYKRPAVYMITVLKSESTPFLSELKGDPTLKDRKCFAMVNEYGRIIEEAIRCFNARNNGMIQIRHYVIMPDHLHFTIRVIEKLKFHIGIYLGYLFKDCSKGLWSRMGLRGESFFKSGYNDKILYQYAQWENWDNYIADNPRRALLRRFFPEYYRNEVIYNEEGLIKNSYGNTSLITYPDKVVVRYTSKRTQEENIKRNEICRELAADGFVLVSPFVHGMEKKLWKEGLERGWKMIKVIEKAYPLRKHPSKTMHEYCSSGNLLIVSLRRIGEKSSPDLTPRDICMEMNGLAEAIEGKSWNY